MARKLVRLIACACAVAVHIGCSPNTSSQPAADKPSSTQAPPSPAAWPVTVQPSTVPTTGTTAEPQLTSSKDGVILSWLEQKGPTAILKFSERTAAGWSPAQTVASGNDWFVSWADVPSVMRSSDGTLVAQWLKAVDLKIEAYDLRLSYSRDNGKKWAAPFAPHHDKTISQHGFATLFESPDKGFGLVWLDGRDTARHQSDPENVEMGVYFATFDPSWKQTAEALANPRVCECCSTSIAVTSEGVIAAFRDRSPKEIRDIAVSRLEKGAWTEAIPVHVDNWQIDSCPVNGPSITARGRQVAASWFTTRDDKGHAYAAFSNDAGRTWSEPVRLDDDTSLGHVDIELLDDGAAVASWVEFTGQRARLRVRRVESSGARSAPVEIAGSAAGRVSGVPRIARVANDLIVAWTESMGEEESNQQVKAAIVRLP
jgi:hypothetical protein